MRAGRVPWITVGTGKTHLATALGHIAVRRRLSVHVARADHMFKRLKAARLDNSTEVEHRRLAAVNVLIIDDFALTPLDETATADFYELTVARHRKNATIVTSNRTPRRMARPHARPAPGPVRRRPAHLRLPRAHRRRRVLPQTPAPRTDGNLTKPITHPKMTQRTQGGP
jgi:hypothetical protein